MQNSCLHGWGFALRKEDFNAFNRVISSLNLYYKYNIVYIPRILVFVCDISNCPEL